MVVDPAGPPCPCGRRGCWERFASGAGLGVLAREAALAGRLDEVVRLAGGDPESVRGEDVSAAAAAGDPAAQPGHREVGWWIGFGLANLAAVLDPECFVLGGGVVQAGDLLIESARATFAELVEGGDRRPLAVVVPAAFGERAGAVGARAGGAPGRVVVMRTGVVLPTFRDTPDEAFAAAAEAVAAGVDGALLLRPHLADRPARAAGAGALPDPRRAGDACSARPGRRRRARSSARWWRGSGLVPNAVLAAQFLALERLAPGGSIAGLGTGDRLSEEENLAYGIPFAPAAERRAEMVGWAASWSAPGSRCGWPAAPPAGPRRRGRPGAALNVWDVEPALVAQRTAGPDGLEVTWAGPPPAASPPMAERLRALHEPAPAGPCSAGRSTSRSWPRRPRGRRRGSPGPAARDPGP